MKQGMLIVTPFFSVVLFMVVSKSAANCERELQTTIIRDIHINRMLVFERENGLNSSRANESATNVR